AGLRQPFGASDAKPARKLLDSAGGGVTAELTTRARVFALAERGARVRAPTVRIGRPRIGARRTADHPPPSGKETAGGGGTGQGASSPGIDGNATMAHSARRRRHPA